MNERLLHTAPASGLTRRGRRRGVLLCCGLLVLAGMGAGTAAQAQEGDVPASLHLDRIKHFEGRRDRLINTFADADGGGFIHVAARLYRDRDPEAILPRLDALLAEPRGDMFWMYPMVLISYLGRERLPASYREQMRALWRTYTPYRGDTENHWAMYYAALYLMAQLYPEEPPEAWYNGRSSRENFEEARAYLLSWMDLTTTKGQGEYDSPHYMSFFIIPMALLYAFAEEAAMQQRAAMMLDYLIADFAAESLEGLYAGAFSRIYPEPVLERWQSASTGFAWLLFGNAPFVPRGEAAVLAMSGYRPPEVLVRMATDRSAPYVHRELKRTRSRIRYSDVRHAPIYKYTYMAPRYAVGSTQGGLLQPIQQHTWEVLWATDDPHEGFNVLFTLHPYASSYELGMYFPEEPKKLEEAVVQSKSTYNEPGKWTGGSPYEQVFQHEDAVIVLYDIPEGTRFPHISGFFSRTLKGLQEDPSGWIVARGGDAYIAYYPLASYVWQEETQGDRRLHSTVLRNGAVVQVAPAEAFQDLEAFREAVRGLPLEAQTEPKPHVRFTTLRGAQLQFAYDEVPLVDGMPVDFAAWPLFDGPFLQAAPGSRRLELRHGRLRRLLDFETLTIQDEIAVP